MDVEGDRAGGPGHGGHRRQLSAHGLRPSAHTDFTVRMSRMRVDDANPADWNMEAQMQDPDGI